MHHTTTISNNPLSSCTLTVLGTGAMGTTPSLVLSSDREGVLFDCGDGTQRLCTEHAVRLGRVGRIYLTSLRASSVGGLGGMLLTKADLSNSENALQVIGPPGTQDMFESFRYFYKRPNAKVQFMDVNAGNVATTTSTAEVAVQPFVTCDAETLSPTTTTSPDEKRPRQASSSPTTTAVSYVIRLPARRGKFKPEIAQSLGVTPGRDFGKLSRGECVVVAATGRTVTPAECLEVAEPSIVAGIVTCPNHQHLARLQAPDSVFHEFIGQHHKAGIRLACLVHLVPRYVFLSPTYQAWMQAFPNDVQHIALGEDQSPERCLFRSSELLQWRLNSVDERMFPRPTVAPPAPSSPPALHNYYNGDVLATMRLAPPSKLGLDISKIPKPVDPLEIQTLGQVLTDIESPHAAPDPPPPTYRILFLGTGSAIPSKYRNVSSFLVKTPRAQDLGILFDCGEGTLQQLARAYGSMTAARQEVAKLGMVWISHIHADHHLGVLAVIEERQKWMATSGVMLPPLVVVGPGTMGKFLHEFFRATQSPCADSTVWRFVNNDAMLSSVQVPVPGMIDVFQVCGLTQIITVPVIHCHAAYGIVMTYHDGFKFVYSGDTEYCEALVTQGHGAHVVVHEATFEDDKEDEAKEKKHSTLSQAVKAAKGMGAKTLLMTHFSQRYPKMPAFDPTTTGTTTTAMNISCAFDLMVASPSGQPPEMWNKLKVLFEETTALEVEGEGVGPTT